MLRLPSNTMIPGNESALNTADEVPVSTSVQEIISANPGYFVRNGTTIIFLILCGIIGGMGFIHYPDTLEGNAIITTNPLPIRIKAGNSGRIVDLFAGDGGSIAKGEPIAELQNNTGYSAILSICSMTDSVARYLKQANSIGLNTILSHPLSAIGEAQPYYNQLLQSISAYLLMKNGKIYHRRYGNLEQQINRYNSVAVITVAETKLNQEELQQSAERFAANEKLYADKVISRQEYYDEAAKLRQKQLTLQAQQKAGIQNKITAGENTKQLVEIEYDRTEKERTLQLNIEEALRNLQNYTQTWKLQYLLIAPFKGTLHYLLPLQINEPAAAGDELFAVIPAHYQYVAQVLLPSSGFGKVKTGQKVQLSLAQFPYSEYGYLEGTVGSISVLPQKPGASGAITTTNETTYRIEILLPDSLVTTYHRPIAFSPEMAAHARVITKDRSLLQRLLNGVAGMNN